MLLKPPVDSWPTYHGDYSGQRHTKLSAITPANVHQLTLAWAFQTGQTQPLKMSPVLANGVIYLTAPDNVWAIDARTARQLWRYTHPTNDAFHIGQRGVAVYKDLVYFTTPDAHLIASGCARWKSEARHRDCRREARLLVDQRAASHPQSSDRRRCGRFRQPAGHPEVVRSRQRQAAVDVLQHAAVGTPGSISGGATGGQMWMTGTYDPELNLLYVGTGNPTPVLNGEARPGDNPWTCSIVAINPDTGKLVWGFQASPHDTHDWDAAEVPVLVDGTSTATPRKMVLQASRNGYYFVLDRTTGKSLLTKPFAAVNWAKEIDKDGRPISASRQGAEARWTSRRAERGGRDELPIAELRSRDRDCWS